MKNGSHNILVIEDNPDVLDAILSILTYGGYQPEGIPNFNDHIIDKLKSQKFSLVILDVMLSGFDGRDLARELKMRAETRDIPIVMISAMPNIESSVTEAGADHFIRKPFGVDELLQSVEKFLVIE